MSAAAIGTSAATRRDFGLKRRHSSEARFRFYGIAAITIGLAFLAILLFSIISKGYTAFVQTTITVPVEFSAEILKFATSPEGKRILRDGNTPDLEKIKGWLDAAQEALAA